MMQVNPDLKGIGEIVGIVSSKKVNSNQEMENGKRNIKRVFLGYGHEPKTHS